MIPVRDQIHLWIYLQQSETLTQEILALLLFLARRVRHHIKESGIFSYLRVIQFHILQCINEIRYRVLETRVFNRTEVPPIEQEPELEVTQ